MDLERKQKIIEVIVRDGGRSGSKNETPLAQTASSRGLFLWTLLIDLTAISP